MRRRGRSAIVRLAVAVLFRDLCDRKAVNRVRRGTEQP